MWATGGEGQDCDARAMASALARASSADQAPISTSRKPTPGGRLIETFSARPLRRMKSTSSGIEALKADGLVFEGQRDGVGGEKGIVETEHREARGRAGWR